MHTLRIAVWLVVVVACTGCSEIKVTTDYDHSADFSGFKTYAWMATDKPRVVGTTEPAESVDRRIRAIVEEQLAARGYTKTSDGEPDFRINYLAALKSMTHVSSVQSYSAGPGQGWNYRYGREDAANVPSRNYVREYRRGSLILDVIEPRTNKLLWRGFAEADITTTAADQKDKRVTRAVAKMLDKFPPR